MFESISQMAKRKKTVAAPAGDSAAPVAAE